MNQSDIRGLSITDRADIDILRHELCFLQREFSSKTAYRKPRSHITLIVPTPVSANPISYFQVSKNSFGGGLIKEIFLSRRFSLFSRLIFYHC